MRKVILLVEDNPSDEKLTILAFKRCSVAAELVVVRDGAAAIEHLLPRDQQSAPALPALVLLDLKLPKIEGLEVLRRIRADPRTKLLPVVVLTASREEEDILNSYALGANAYVRKPVEFSAFEQVAETIGTFWLLLNEPAPAPPPVP